MLELLPLTLEDHAQELDRVRIEAVQLPAGDLDETEPVGEERWLWRAEMGARLGGRPGAAAFAPEVESAVARLESGLPDDGRGRHRASPTTRCRAGARRGGCSAASTGWASTAATTPSSATSRAASPGHERALALEVGEALLRAGFLAEKPSVGQRHVSLVAARTSDIRALVERGTCDEPLRSLLA